MGHALNGDAAAQQAIDGQTDPAKANLAWAPMAVKEIADQHHEEAKVQAVGAAASAGVRAYALTLPNDGGSSQELIQPKAIQRFDAATFTWDGGNNYTDNPYATVERRVGGGWVTFADQSGEIPVTLKYPASSEGTFDPAALVNGIVGYRAGGQVWKWTAAFEAFVSRFPLVDPQGRAYMATPPGAYRFVVHGLWRQAGASTPYARVSNPFTVSPWTGITVGHAHLDQAGHVVFAAGPTHVVREQTVRRTARPPFAANDAPVAFTIGPVDFPDTAADQRATGARFLNSLRGYSGTGMDNVEHYCLDCSFRPWLDATNDLTATLVLMRAGGGSVREHLTPDAGGQFVSHSTLAPGDRASITIDDAWGDRTAAATTVTAK
jgi:hypothetical protein